MWKIAVGEGIIDSETRRGENGEVFIESFVPRPGAGSTAPANPACPARNAAASQILAAGNLPMESVRRHLSRHRYKNDIHRRTPHQDLTNQMHRRLPSKENSRNNGEVIPNRLF